MSEIQVDSKKAELLMREKVKSLYGIENLTILECRSEGGKWYFKFNFFPTRGQDYEETKRCCVNENGEFQLI